EPLHQPQGESGAERIEHGESPPAFCSRPVIASRCRGRCERLERSLYPRRQARALGFDPVLELRGIAKIEAVEKRARVQGRSPLGIPTIEGLLEILRVGAQHPRVDAQLAGTEEQVVGRQVVAERVQRLVQEMTRLLL